jgi:hypothetical protein
MTDEVDTSATAERTETDWAMMYADERRLRIKAQRRCASFLANSSSLAVNADKLVRMILTQNHADKDMINLIIKTVRDCDDLGGDINLNLFSPIWDITEAEQAAMAGADSIDKIPRAYRDRTDALVQQAAKDTLKEWEDTCERMNFNSPKEVYNQTKAEISELLIKRIRADEKQSSETH